MIVDHLLLKEIFYNISLNEERCVILYCILQDKSFEMINPRILQKKIKNKFYRILKLEDIMKDLEYFCKVDTPLLNHVYYMDDLEIDEFDYKSLSSQQRMDVFEYYEKTEFLKRVRVSP